jgi:hypothetical protein
VRAGLNANEYRGVTTNASTCALEIRAMCADSYARPSPIALFYLQTSHTQVGAYELETFERGLCASRIISQMSVALHIYRRSSEHTPQASNNKRTIAQLNPPHTHSHNNNGKIGR